MKKNIINILLSIFLFIWLVILLYFCFINDKSLEVITDENKDETKTEQLSNYIEEWTWYVWSPGWWEVELITWYIYTYLFPEVWLKIITPVQYNDTFYKKRDDLLFVLSGNRISYIPSFWDEIKDKENYVWDYIEIFEKKAEESLDEILTSSIDNKCILESDSSNYDWFEWSIMYSINTNPELFQVEKPWLVSDRCELEWGIYIESKDKTKYYKIYSIDWCAPWPCSAFWKIEFI